MTPKNAKSTARVVSNDLGAAKRLLAQARHAAVVEVAGAARARIQQTSPRRTGSMAASAYVTSRTGDGYAAAAEEALGLNPKIKLFEAAPAPASTDEAILAMAAGHAPFVEFGTVKMAAQPTFTPAVEQARADLPGAVEKAVQARIATLGK